MAGRVYFLTWYDGIQSLLYNTQFKFILAHFHCGKFKVTTVVIKRGRLSRSSLMLLTFICNFWQAKNFQLLNFNVNKVLLFLLLSFKSRQMKDWVLFKEKRGDCCGFIGACPVSEQSVSCLDLFLKGKGSSASQQAACTTLKISFGS